MHNETILESLISIDTQVQKSTLEAVYWIKEYLNKYGAKTEFLFNQDKTRATLISTIGDKNQKGYVFSGHLDTVPADSSFYKNTAFKLLKEGDKYYGRGVCDMKGSIACFLSQVPEIVKNGKTAHLVLTHDEEGVFSAIEQLSKNKEIVEFLKTQKGCVVMEPTNLKPVTSHKGTRLFEVDVVGKSGHSSNPSICIDAIDIAVESYNLITSSFKKLSQKYGANQNFIEPFSTLTIGKFCGGEAVNTVSANASYTILSRENPQNDYDAFFQDILNGFETKGKIEMKQKLYALSFKSSFKEQFLSYIGKTECVSYGTEAGFFEKMGLPTVVCGAGDIAQAHTKDEYIYIEQIKNWNKLLLDIIIKE